MQQTLNNTKCPKTSVHKQTVMYYKEKEEVKCFMLKCEK